MVGSGDIHSLADLANSFEVVRTMQTAPITRDAILRRVGAALVPIVPLALTMMPLEELLKMLFGMLFQPGTLCTPCDSRTTAAAPASAALP